MDARTPRCPGTEAVRYRKLPSTSNDSFLYVGRCLGALILVSSLSELAKCSEQCSPSSPVLVARKEGFFILPVALSFHKFQDFKKKCCGDSIKPWPSNSCKLYAWPASWQRARRFGKPDGRVRGL